MGRGVLCTARCLEPSVCVPDCASAEGLNAVVIVHYFAVASVIMSGLWLALVEQVRCLI